MKETFTRFSLQHHHREYNMMADTLSKQGLQMDEGTIMYKEIHETDTGTWETHQIY